MADRASLYIPVDITADGDNFTATIQFFDEASGVLTAPTTVEYRIDCLTNDHKVLDWTSVTTGDTVSIAVAGTYNTIITAANSFERKQITVCADRGLTFQCIDQKQWLCKNLNEGT
jgi:hypothetical protein